MWYNIVVIIQRKEKTVTKHIFIVNPAAGKGPEAAQISEVIRDACDACGVDYEIHQTTCRGDAQAFTRAKVAAKPVGDEYNFYACGGDGTLSDVVSGLVGAPKKPQNGVSVGCVPIGTGNDFTRNFTQSEFFLDITKQLLADPVVIDCFSVEGNTPESHRCCINMVNIGFDCDVVVKAGELKKRKFLPKSLAYILGVVIMLKNNLGKAMTVIYPDGRTLTREFQLVAVANGGFCGGGFHSAPESKLDDGRLDLSLIKKVSRTNFLRLVGHYKNGTHLKTRLGKKVVNYQQIDEIELRFSEETNVCIDGEIFKLRDVRLKSIPRSIRFLLPVGVELKQ